MEAELRETFLREADLREADLGKADLSGADLSEANVFETRFSNNQGISEDEKNDLIQRGAIFDDSPGDREDLSNLVSR